MSRVIKVVTAGDGGVGKSSFAHYINTNQFEEDYRMTIGVEFVVKDISVRGQIVKVQLWDVGGQERFSYARGLFYRGAGGVILIYDITRRATFDNIKKYHIPQILEMTNPVAKQKKAVYNRKDTSNLTKNIVNETPVKMILVGNKIDLSSDREVSYEEGIQLAREMGDVDFFETSCRTGENVYAAFENLVDRVVFSSNQQPKTSGKHVALQSNVNIARNYEQIQKANEQMNIDNRMEWERYKDMGIIDGDSTFGEIGQDAMDECTTLESELKFFPDTEILFTKK